MTPDTLPTNVSAAISNRDVALFNEPEKFSAALCVRLVPLLKEPVGCVEAVSCFPVVLDCAPENDSEAVNVRKYALPAARAPENNADALNVRPILFVTFPVGAKFAVSVRSQCATRVNVPVGANPAFRVRDVLLD